VIAQSCIQGIAAQFGSSVRHTSGSVLLECCWGGGPNQHATQAARHEAFNSMQRLSFPIGFDTVHVARKPVNCQSPRGKLVVVAVWPWRDAGTWGRLLMTGRPGGPSLARYGLPNRVIPASMRYLQLVAITARPRISCRLAFLEGQCRRMLALQLRAHARSLQLQSFPAERIRSKLLEPGRRCGCQQQASRLDARLPGLHHSGIERSAVTPVVDRDRTTWRGSGAPNPQASSPAVSSGSWWH
jgi:hypothetical protein